MYFRDVTVLFQKVLVDQIDARDLHDLILELRIILDVDAVGYGHVGDRRRLVDILDANLSRNIRPVHMILL